MCPKVSDWTIKSYSTEKKFFYDVMENIFVTFGKVTLEPNYKSKVVKGVDSYEPSRAVVERTVAARRLRLALPITNGDTGIACDHLGIGDISAWYGTPDARIVSTSLDNSTIVLLAWEHDIDKNEDSDGDSVLVEGKLSISGVKHFPQAVATLVTHSFTEFHKHGALNSMVPLILLNNTSFVILLYDCKQDVLLYNTASRYFSSIALQLQEWYNVLNVSELPRPCSRDLPQVDSKNSRSLSDL